MEKIKILVFSISAISDVESNGRVLRNLLPDVEEIEYLNVYISGNPIKDSKVQYLHISDKTVLKSVLSLGLSSKEDPINYEEKPHSLNNGVNSKKSAFKYFLRNKIWSLAFSIKKRIVKKAKNFNPNIVFLMGANLPAFYSLSTKISKKTGAPLFIYNAEDYPLKNYDYMSQKKKSTFFSNIVLKKLRKESIRAYQHSFFNAFNSEKLLDSFIKDGFCSLDKSTVIRIPSSFSAVSKIDNKNRIIFAGNLYDDRCETLLKFADALSSIKISFNFCVYGKITNNKYLETIKNHNAIEYRGVVPYSIIQKELVETSFLLDVEGFSEYSKLDYKHSFSTKIADYLMLGIPIICYGSKEIAGVDYLLKNNEDFTIISDDSLSEKLTKILTHQVAYKYNKLKICNEFSITEVRKRILDIFEKIASEGKI